MQLAFRSLHENELGEAWKTVFNHGAPGWRQWFMQRIGEATPDLIHCERALKRHVPEYHPIWEKQLELINGDPLTARFLSFWTPPRYLVNCSQAVLHDENTGPLLIRNYDLDPRLNEATLYSTNWTGNRRVMGMVEGMAGLSDGMNDDGLAISLTFGGRAAAGKGFGIPLIMRYVLEMARDTQDALEILRNIPSHMSYNLTLVDSSGSLATVFMSPDRPIMIEKKPFTTNHQLGNEWPAHARMSETIERAEILKHFLGQPQHEASLKQRFQSEPVFRRGYDKGFGTVFTALYRPKAGNMELLWPGHKPLTQSFEHFTPKTQLVKYSTTSLVGERPYGEQQAAAITAEPVPVVANDEQLTEENLWGAEQYLTPEVMQLIKRSWRGFATSWHN